MREAAIHGAMRRRSTDPSRGDPRRSGTVIFYDIHLDVFASTVRCLIWSELRFELNVINTSGSPRCL